ncbi:hypothetical protein [Asaia prunellae]|nr:hypothetical protein [Asaia prunellae]
MMLTRCGAFTIIYTRAFGWMVYHRTDPSKARRVGSLVEAWVFAQG